jgi:hypothetical protein
MTDYEIGYGKPPKSTMFAPKSSGNPKGRPPRRYSEISEIVDAFLNAPMEYREGGFTKIATRQEIQLKLVVRRAVSGDVKAAEQILQTLDRARRSGEGGAQRLIITDWLPDFVGQTAAQKTSGACASSACASDDEASSSVQDQGARISVPQGSDTAI